MRFHSTPVFPFPSKSTSLTLFSLRKRTAGYPILCYKLPLTRVSWQVVTNDETISKRFANKRWYNYVFPVYALRGIRNRRATHASGDANSGGRCRRLRTTKPPNCAQFCIRARPSFRRKHAIEERSVRSRLFCYSRSYATIIGLLDSTARKKEIYVI